MRGLKASFKVFVLNKIGDFFVLVLICLLLGSIGASNFTELNYMLLNYINYNFYLGSFQVSFIELLGIILVLGGSVKSAQYGFHI